MDADEVNIAVDEGMATLTGEVDACIKYHFVTENIYENGAVWVYNMLMIN
jgi:hypothetical protein